MASPVVSDTLWEVVKKHLPPRPERDPRRGGRPWVDDRSCLNGVVLVLRTGMPWNALPRELGFGSGVTCWRRLRDWQIAGVWARVHADVLARLDWQGQLDTQDLLVDGSKVPAKRGGTGIGRNPTDRGKPGIKRHLMTDAHGVPLAIRTTGAQQQECTMLEVLVPDLPPMAAGTPVHGDKGYDIPRCFRALHDAGLRSGIRRRGVDPPETGHGVRWPIERTFAWLNQYRRLMIRYERRAEIHLAFLQLACILICEKVRTWDL